MSHSGGAMELWIDYGVWSMEGALALQGFHFHWLPQARSSPSPELRPSCPSAKRQAPAGHGTRDTGHHRINLVTSTSR
jgi:hypothetical protein